MIRPLSRWPRRTIAVAAALVVLSAAVAQASATERGQSVDLAGGRLGNYEWSVRVQRPAGGAPAAQRPCLSVSALWRRGRFDYRRTRFRQCAEASGRLAAADGPLVASAGQPSDRSSARITAVGMLFAPSVARVKITLAGGNTRTVRLDKLTSSQAQAAGLRPVRYAAFVVHGNWCAERLVSENAAGKTLWDSGVDEYTCASGG
jgi:hypothetical protein